MPIYEFICRDCEKPFERLIPASRRDSAQCAHCGSQRTMRKISMTAPAQIKAAGGPSAQEGCGLPSCCGGACALPN